MMLRKIVLAILTLGLLLTVFGSRSSIIARYTMDLPEWDQWDAEGVHLLVPWARGDVWPALFTPHNEHYVLVTKLANLGLTLANGQWDQRLECVANTLLPGFLAVSIVIWARNFASAFQTVAIALLSATAWSIPIAWQNVVSGFHSQQFFLILLSAVAILCLPFADACSWRWWVGAAAAALAPLSMASGVLASAAAAGVIILRLLRRATTLRASGPALAIAGVIGSIAWWTRHEVDHHAALKAMSLHDFVIAVCRGLQWPAPGSLWLALVVWLPWLALAGRVLRARVPAETDRYGWSLLGLGSWVWLQVLAAGYARGAGGPEPAIRYLDTLLFGWSVNLISLAWLWSRSQPAWPMRSLLAIVSAAWVGVGIWGGAIAVKKSVHADLPQLIGYHQDSIIRTRAYLATGDTGYLKSGQIPYPNADILVQRLARPELSRLLPASVRPAISLQPRRPTSGFMPVYHEVLASAPVTPDASDPFGDLGNASAMAPAFRRGWSSFASSAPVAEWTSEPVAPPPHGSRLVFAVAGPFPSDDTVLELLAASTHELLARVAAPPAENRSWRYAIVTAPTQPFLIRARDASGDTFLAFTEPVVMPRLSYTAWLLARNGLAIATTGIILMLVAVAVELTLFLRSRGMSSRERPEATVVSAA